MKYIISENKIDKIIFKYLDNNLKGFEKRKANHYEGFVFAFPNEEYGILGYENNGALYVYYGLIEEISNGFGLNQSDSKSVITRWVSDRLQLEVINTGFDFARAHFEVSDRLQLEVINTKYGLYKPAVLVSDRLQLEVINTPEPCIAKSWIS